MNGMMNIAPQLIEQWLRVSADKRKRARLLSKFMGESISFSIFTNGTVLTESDIRFLKNYKNIQIFFSLEGTEVETDLRRGSGVYACIVDKMKIMKKMTMFQAVSITVTPDNIQAVTSDRFIFELVSMGCCFFNFVEFEDIGGDSKSLKLNEAQRNQLAISLVRLKSRYKSTIFTAFPSYEYKAGGCLAAGRGFFHINAYGDAEPCNFVPLSDTNVKGKSLLDAIESPLFQKLRNDNILDAPQNGECALLSKKDELEELLRG